MVQIKQSPVRPPPLEGTVTEGNLVYPSDPKPGFNIATFRAHIGESGVQKTNKFLVRIPMPVGLASHTDFTEMIKTVRFLEFWAEASSIPGITINSHMNLRYGYGAFEKKPVAPIFQDIPIVFLDDGKGAIHHFIHEWMNMIVNHDMSHGITPTRRTGQVANHKMDPYEIAYKYEYAVDINIVMFDDTGEETKSIVLREAWPILMNDIQVSWQASGEVSRVPVIFTYHDWYSNFAPVRTNIIRRDI